jgi:hypothetical protein
VPDRQFLHRRGFACVRSGAEGFVWLSNPQGRVSDINTSADKDIDHAGVSLRAFRNRCDAVCCVHDIVIRCVELSIKIGSTFYDNRVNGVSPNKKPPLIQFSDLFERHENQSNFSAFVNMQTPLSAYSPFSVPDSENYGEAVVLEPFQGFPYPSEVKQLYSSSVKPTVSVVQLMVSKPPMVGPSERAIESGSTAAVSDSGKDSVSNKVGDAKTSYR